MPLAARLRPRTLDEVVGHEALLGEGKPLRRAIASGEPGSFLLWGPPGSGKTTIARLVAHHVEAEFVPFSAVTDGIPRLREIVAAAEKRGLFTTRTILFIDEIHRFNRAQQDALLPQVESGLLTLIGATTENPSFELTGALLSRLRVVVLQPLTATAIATLLDRAMQDPERGLGGLGLTLEPGARDALAQLADGDARRALTVLETAASLATDRISPDVVEAAIQQRVAQYDKSGEQHFNLISAYHKALRGSDPQGALYWLARMIEGGEDPRYIARRTIRFAAEDVGLADPQALTIALAAREAFEVLGSPEGELALAEAAVYLATAPKSNRVYVAWGAALDAARRSPAAPVPLHIRNAPTALMRDLGYGAGYQYAHDAPDAFVPQDYLPDEVADATFYAPGAMGMEKEIAKRMAWWEERRRGAEG